MQKEYFTSMIVYVYLTLVDDMNVLNELQIFTMSDTVWYSTNRKYKLFSSHTVRISVSIVLHVLTLHQILSHDHPKPIII